MSYIADTFKFFAFFILLISHSYFVNDDNDTNYSSNSAVDLSEVTGKEQMEAQPVKKGRGRKQ